jgi:hypothetical protein
MWLKRAVPPHRLLLGLLPEPLALVPDMRFALREQSEASIVLLV